MRRLKFLWLGLGGLALGALVWVYGQQPDPARLRQLGLPEGTVQLTPCLPGMGEHWARLQDMPFGPIYGVMGERVVFVEVMIAQSDFAAGKSWTDLLKPFRGHQIDHTDIEFHPQGHEGYEIPHYDVHAYFVAHEEHVRYCP